MDDAINARGVSHAFGRGEAAVRVLHEVDFDLRRGELVVLMGPSGSGKTTLLTLLGCLREVQTGSVKLLGRELCGADARTLMLCRRRLGFIFQAHNLHGSLTAAQNVRMGLDVHDGLDAAVKAAACEQSLALVGLGDRSNFLPEQLSGGQKQRVAVARAVVGGPEVIFADEPTAALDQQTSRQVVALLRRLADRRATAVLMVTHDHRVLDVADRVVKMEDGRVVADS